MKTASLAIATVLAFGAAACRDRHDEPEKGADIDFSASNRSGERVVVARADGETGRVAVSTPAFDINMKLPKIALGADDFDISGVKLYPGSKIDSIVIDAEGDDDGDRAAVDVGFTAPANAITVRDWFAARFAEKSLKVKKDADGLTGKTADGDEFVIELKDTGDAGSAGTIHIVG